MLHDLAAIFVNKRMDKPSIKGAHFMKSTISSKNDSLYKQALQYCVRNDLDNALYYMREAVKAGHPLAQDALKNIETIGKRQAK